MAETDRAAHRRLFSFDAAFAEGNPYPHYAWFRRHDPVHLKEPNWPMGKRPALLFRHEDVHQWLRDPRMLREAEALEEVRDNPEYISWRHAPQDSFGYMAHRFMLFRDPPAHTRLRGLANRAFTPRVVADRRAEIEELANSLVAAFREEGGEGDLIQALAYPLPVLVIARVLGVPAEDMHRFRDWAAVLGAAIDLPTEGLEAFVARADEATHEMSEYLRGIVAKRKVDPQDDLLTRLIVARDEEGRVTDDELIATAILLMIAGHETTVNLIANGALALMRHRDQWERLVAEPALVANATEELLRYDSPVQLTGRIATEDVEIDGVMIERGAQVMFMLGSGNRDEALWEDADDLRIDREVGRYLSFGMGIHFCLGAPLAKLEGEVTFATLAREAPNLELVDPNPKWRPGAVLHGLQRLDVRMEV
ncbi:MAG TPA: cytochrome P450 [Thermomicrobiales bacterium]|nr:cytochrome P450 [Thermomicrobiales bacterium]